MGSETDLGEWAKPVLAGTRVTLRPYRPADLDATWEMVNEPEGAELTGTTATFTREQIAAWVASRPTAPERLDLVIEESATGEYAGEVVLNEHDAAARSANLRIVLRGPAWFGRGLGSEAVALMVAHAFTAIGLDRVTLDVRGDNPRAIRAYEKSGFAVTGREVEDGIEWVDMALTRDAWESRA